MQTAEVKTSSSAQSHIQAKQQPFFSKEGQDSFFSSSKETTSGFRDSSSSFFAPPGIQAKLTIGQPNDKYEVEADAMADKVVQKLANPETKENSSVQIQPKSNFTTNTASPSADIHGNVIQASSKVPAIQAKCEACEKEDRLQRKEEDLHEIPKLQTKPIFESDADETGHNVQAKSLDSPTIQRKCAACEEEEQVQRKVSDEGENIDGYFGLHEYDHLEQEADTIASSIMGGQMNLPPPENESPGNYDSNNNGDYRAQTLGNTAQLASGGNPLNESTQVFYENRLGCDLSHVRIHTGPEADKRAHSIGAHAFTFKNHIWLGSGQDVKPSFLLAHELIHVLQQTKPEGIGSTNEIGINHPNGLSGIEVRTNPFYWVPIGVKKALSGTAIHKEILNKIAEENEGIDREVAIPNADREKNVGYGYKGQADLHQGESSNRIGLYFDSVPGSSKGKPKKLIGKRRKGEPRVDENGLITGINDAPTKITLGELKPIDKDLMKFGESQMESYEEGMEFAQSQTNKWSNDNPQEGESPQWNDLSFDRFDTNSYKIPEKFAYDPNNPKDNRNLGVGTYIGKGEGVRVVFNPGLRNPIKGGLYAEHGDNGIIVYFSRPKNPQKVLDRVNLSDLQRSYAAYATELQNEIINKLYESPKKVDAFSKRLSIGSNKLSRKTRDNRTSLSGKSTPLILRKNKKFKLDDPFNLGKWKKSRKSFSKKFLSGKSENQREDLQLVNFMYEAEESLQNQGIPEPPKDKKLPPKSELDFEIESTKSGKKGKKETAKKKLNLTDLYDWMKLWSSSKIGFIGILRDKFGGTFVKVVQKINSLKLKLQQRIEKAKKEGSKKGNSFGKVAIRAFWRAAAKIGGIVLSNTVGLLVEGLQNGIKAKLTEVIPEDVATLSNIMEDDFAELRELGDNLDGLKTEIENKLDETITRFETEIEALKVLAKNAERFGKYIKWAMIALNCGTPPLWGCLKVLAKGLMAKMVDEILQWCWTQEKFAGIVLSTGWFDSIPGTIAHGVSDKVEQFLPENVKPIFDRTAYDSAKRPPASDIPCDEGPTPEQMALAELDEKLRENLGEEGYKLLTIAFEKYGVYMEEELTVTEIEEIKSRVPGNVTPEELEKFIAAHPRPSPGKRKIIDVAEFLKVVKESAEFNWFYIAHPPKTGHTKHSSVNVEVSISDVQACSGWRELTTVIVPAKVTKRLWKGETPKRYFVIFYRPRADFELDLGDRRLTLFKDKEFWGYRPDACRIRKGSQANAQNGEIETDSSAEDVDINRKCSKCEQEKEEHSTTSGNRPVENSQSFSKKLNKSKGSGEVLPAETNAEMSEAFMTDFSAVRIHKGSRAMAMTNQINAQAFTHGRDIYFNTGKFNPVSESGKHLLAHELTHTIQQNGRKNSIQRSTMDEFRNEYPAIASEISRLSDAYRNLILHIDPLFQEHQIYNLTESRVIQGIPVSYLQANNAQRLSRRRLFTYETEMNQEALFDLEHVSQWRIFYLAALRHLRPLFIALIDLGGETGSLGQFYRDEQRRLLSEASNLTTHFPGHAPQEEVDEGADRLSAEREAGDLRWYLQADIPSPLIRTGTSLTVALRNNNHLRAARRAELAQAGRGGRGELQFREGEIPVYSWEEAEFGVIDEADREYPWNPSTSGYPLEFEHTFNQQGRRIIYFRGKPNEFSRTDVYVQYTIFVGDGASAPFLEEATGVTETDLELMTNEDTGYGELLSLFKRLTARRALEMLSDNKSEAIQLRRHYERLMDNPHSAPHYDLRTGFVFRLAPIHQNLHNLKTQIRTEIDNTEVSIPTGITAGGRELMTTDAAATERRRQPLRNRLSNVETSIAQIEMVYPEVAALRRFENDIPLRENIESSVAVGSGFVGRMVRTIATVERDIDRTRRRITTGHLDVMQIKSLTGELRERLVPQNPNLATALNNYHEDSGDLWTSLGLTGASIALLFVPGVGPFLSAAVGLAGGAYQAAESWEEAEIYRSGHNAGLREGVFSEEQQEEMRMRAVMDTLWMVVDMADFGMELGELGSAVQALGEISNVRRSSRRAENLPEELMEGEAHAARRLTDGNAEIPSLNPPQGVARPESTDQRRLLQGSSQVEDGRLLTEAELETELDIVRRSEIQPATRGGYVGEVQLGNGHTWRQQPDGTWCRFSEDPSLCGTVVRFTEEAAVARADSIAFNQIVDRLVQIAQSRNSQGALDLTILSSEEREIIEQVFSDVENIDQLTLRDLQGARGRLGQESERLLERRDAEIVRIRRLNQPLYDSLRAISPRDIRLEYLRRYARRRDPLTGDIVYVDEITQLPAASPLSSSQLQAGHTINLHVDHIIPLEEIIDSPGFRELRPEAQRAIVNHPDLLIAMDHAANSSKGNRNWTLWPQASFYYSQEQIATMIAKEQDVRLIIARLIREHS